MNAITRRSLWMLGACLAAAAIAFAAPTTQSASAQIGGCVTKTDAPDPVAPGGTITYTITFSTTFGDGSDALLTDETPAQTTFTSFTAPPGWTVTTPFPGSSGPVTASHFGPVSGTYTFTLVVTVLPTAAGVIANLALMDYRTEILFVVTCTAEATTTVSGAPPEVCPPDDDGDDDGLNDFTEQNSLFTLLGDSDSDDDGIVDGNDDENGNGEDDEDEDDDEGDGCPDEDSDGDGEDDEDEDDEDEDDNDD